MQRDREILIIEDDYQTGVMLGDFFGLMGFKPTVYNRATRFFENNVFLYHNPIMVLDLNMPDMDGIEVIRHLALKCYDLPIILISGCEPSVLHSAEQLAKTLSLNVIASINKPLLFKPLESIINRYIESQETEISTSINPKLALTDIQLAQAFDNNQLVVYYQPQTNISDNSIFGVEALVRLNHTRYGLIYPDQFICQAESIGLIEKLTSEVLRQSFEQAAIWKKMNLNLNIAVDISAHAIISLSLPDELDHLLSQNNIMPSQLTLEVTESAMIFDKVKALDILTRIRMKGINLSLDDFGTGFSSLSLLYSAPFNELKIDKSFVAQMTQDRQALSIVKTCILLGHELGMKVIAEGVEDSNTLSLLNSLKCDVAQGYYIAEPLSAQGLLEYWSLSV